jgi:hypothetical protein
MDKVPREGRHVPVPIDGFNMFLRRLKGLVKVE